MKCSLEEAIYGLTSHPSMGDKFKRELSQNNWLGYTYHGVVRNQTTIIDSARDENEMPLIYFHKGEFWIVDADTIGRVKAYRAQEKAKADAIRDSNLHEHQLRHKLLKEAGAIL